MLLHTRDDDACQRLMSILGVVAVSAVTLAATIDDPARFRRSRSVAFNYPQVRPARSRPILMSIRRDQTRHMTVLPGGGFRSRAIYPPSLAIFVG